MATLKDVLAEFAAVIKALLIFVAIAMFVPATHELKEFHFSAGFLEIHATYE